MKKTKTSPYFVSELAHIVSACEERLPFVYLGDEVCVISFVLGD